MLRCPFCDSLIVTDSNGVGVCPIDKFTVKVTEATAYAGPDSPMYVKEAEEFLRYVAKYKPQYVVSTFPLFHKQFRLVDTCFVGSVGAVPGTDKYTESKSHIIAGAHVLGYKVDLFLATLMSTVVDVNPLANDTWENARKSLFIATLTNSSTVLEKSLAVARRYLSPTLEGMLPNSYGVFNNNKALFDNDVAMFAVVFGMPQINVGWGIGVSAVDERIDNYIRDIVQNSTYTKYTTKKRSLEEEYLFNHLSNAVAAAGISTAINQTFVDTDFYDILNNNDVRVVIDDLMKVKRPEQYYTIALQTYKEIATLQEMILSQHKRVYGKEAKEKFLQKKGISRSTESISYDFWNAIKELYYS